VELDLLVTRDLPEHQVWEDSEEILELQEQRAILGQLASQETQAHLELWDNKVFLELLDSKDHKALLDQRVLLVKKDKVE